MFDPNNFWNLYLLTEAATETIFQNICYFFQEQPFYNFPGGSICTSNHRHKFSRRVYRTDMFFQEGSICSSNRTCYLIEQILIFPETLIYFLNTYKFSRRLYFLIEQDIDFPGASIFSSNRNSFSRKSYLVLEHIIFSRRPLCLKQIGIFQEGIPLRTDILLIDLGGCF